MPQNSALREEIRKFGAYYARHPNSLAFARLADAYRKAGRMKKALALLNEGLRRHPRYVAAHSVRARTLRGMGRPSEAADAFRVVLELDPQNLVALQALGDMAEEEGKTQEAAEWYQRLKEVKAPSDFATRPSLREPEVVRDRGAPEEMEGPAWGDELVATPTLADLLMRQELYEEAALLYERLLRSRPGDPQLQAKLDAAKRLSIGRPADRRRRESGSSSIQRLPPTEPGDGITVREYLNRLLESRAEPKLAGPTGASRFRRWLELAKDDG